MLAGVLLPSTARTLEGGVYLTMLKEEEQQPSKTRSALTIGTDGTTAIIDVSRLIDSPSATTKSGWYDLNGRRLNAAPTRSGLYIYNGKIGFFVNLGGNSSPTSYHYRGVLPSGHQHLPC